MAARWVCASVLEVESGSTKKKRNVITGSHFVHFWFAHSPGREQAGSKMPAGMFERPAPTHAPRIRSDR